MGLGGISLWQLLIILLIVVVIFGTKRLRGIGSDLGGAVKGFRAAMSEEDKKDEGAQKRIQGDEEDADFGTPEQKAESEASHEKQS